MNDFLPQNYEVPKGKSNYFKFEKGKNKFRAISSAVIGYEYWNTENKPVRLKEYPMVLPTDIRTENGVQSEIKHFWAFTVIDRADGLIKIVEITQKGIMRELQSLVSNLDWGMPQGYDITVERTGDKLETKYTVMPSPHKPLTQDEERLIKETPVNLEALFTGADPFNTQPVEQEAPKEVKGDYDFDIEDVSIGDVKF